MAYAGQGVALTQSGERSVHAKKKRVAALSSHPIVAACGAPCFMAIARQRSPYHRKAKV